MVVRARSRMAFAVVAVLASSIPSTGPAKATGTGNVEFSVRGTIPTFPCEVNCPTLTFKGTGNGDGKASAQVNGYLYDATFTLFNAAVEGSASYNEPGLPFCPLIGSASNPVDPSTQKKVQVWLGSGTGSIITGIVRSTRWPIGGTISDMTVLFEFAYDRVGVTAAVRILSGLVTVHYEFAGFESGSFTEHFIPVVPGQVAAGVGTGIFKVDPASAAFRCLPNGAGPLDFDLIGDVVAATS